MLTRLGRRYRRDEEGSALLLALILLSILSIGLGALLWFSDTSIRATLAVRSQGSNTYAADGAVQAAINAVRPNSAMGVDPSAAGAQPCVVTQTVGINGVTPTVSCTGLPGSGSQPNTPTNTVPYAFLALGWGANPSTDGVNFIVKNGHNVIVNGNVASDYTAASTGAGVTTVNGNLSAVSTCSSITATGAVTCPNGPNVTDAVYGMGISAPPAAGSFSPPSGCAAGTTRTFQPGTYTNTTVLTACANNVFQPASDGTTGYYYFNFPNAASSWNVNSVIGGTLTADQLDCDPSKPGVEFIFGGQSNIVIGTSAKFHVCANPNLNSQQIALYGVGHLATLNPATPVVSSTVYTNPNNAIGLDGVNATANITTVGISPPTTSAVSVQTFANSIPAGANINSVKLRIRHFESGANPGNIASSVVITPGGGSALAPISVPNVTGALGYFSSGELTTQGVNTISAISGLKAIYSSTISGALKSATENVDAILLDVIWSPAGFNAPETGCSGTCPLIQPSGNSNGADVVFKGTVYAPLADVSVNATNSSAQEFVRGVIAQSISVNLTGSVVVNYVIAGVPPTSVVAAANRTVLFHATGANGPEVTATVVFNDTQCPSRCGATATVVAWSVSR